MATTNFEQWNNASLNQETDAEYLADAQRIGGVTTGSLAPSATMNKFYYQVSTFVTAFGQMLATKGYTNSDASLPTLASVLANVLTEADMGAQIVSVPYSPTPAFNAASNNGFQMMLTGNITASTISGVTPGQLIAFYFVQDSVGGRTVSWPSLFAGALQPDTAASSVSVMLFRADLSGNMRAVSPMISNNGIFLGNSYAVTPAASDNSTKVSTTAWNLLGLSFSFFYGASYVRLPTWLGGITLQWGIGPSMPPNSTGIVYLPISFRSINYVPIIGQVRQTGGNSVFVMVDPATVTISSFGLTTGAGEFIGTASPFWFAIGY